MTKKKATHQVDWRVSSVAIVCLTILELGAMYYGINGTMRTIIFSMIALIVGVKLPQDTIPKLIKILKQM